MTCAGALTYFTNSIRVMQDVSFEATKMGHQMKRKPLYTPFYGKIGLVYYFGYLIKTILVTNHVWHTTCFFRMHGIDLSLGDQIGEHGQLRTTSTSCNKIVCGCAS